MRRRSYSRRMVSAPIQSFKKVINHAPASRVASTTINMEIANGVDSVAAGQTSAIDVNVPTGSVIKYIDIQYSAQNLVNVAAFLWTSIIQLRSGQGNVAPNVVGGDPQRNQVHHQDFRCIGQNQNVNVRIRFKIPKRFQRVRDGDKWRFLSLGDQVHTSAAQIIYKFYR